MFKPVLAFFLLEMGLIASGQLGSLKRGVKLAAFALVMPLIGALIALLARFMGLSLGGTAMLATLAASASYIAVPAAMRLAVPEANPSLSLTASLGITFPFNILIGIPLYLALAERLIAWGSDMNAHNRTLLTVICEAALEADLKTLGAPGWTLSDARRQPRVRSAGWDTDGNIRLEVICNRELAERIAEHLQRATTRTSPWSATWPRWKCCARRVLSRADAMARAGVHPPPGPMELTMHALLQEILDEVRPLLGQGRVASIPALADVAPDQLGIAAVPMARCSRPATRKRRSRSRAFPRCSAWCRPSDTAVSHWGTPRPRTLGSRSPAGAAGFERGRPRNPFINAGALVICDVNQSRFATPELSMRDFVRHLSGNPLVISDTRVAESEYQHRARNAAMAYLMQSFGNFHNDVEAVLRSYFHHCALRMSCVDLARAFGFLARDGPQGGEAVLTPRQAKQVNAIMATSGLYDEAGNFAYRVGLPGKSGVGGGIVAVVPGRFTVCVWSPELNAAGNSLIGMAALEALSQRIGWSVF